MAHKFVCADYTGPHFAPSLISANSGGSNKRKRTDEDNSEEKRGRAGEDDDSARRRVESDDEDDPETEKDSQVPIHQRSIRTLRKEMKKNPELVASYELQLEEIFLSSPHIDPGFKQFALAMKQTALWYKQHTNTPMDSVTKHRLSAWYTDSMNEATVPLLPKNPAGRPVWEALHWMEVESQGFIADRFADSLKLLVRHLRITRQSIVDQLEASKKSNDLPPSFDLDDNGQELLLLKAENEEFYTDQLALYDHVEENVVAPWLEAALRQPMYKEWHTQIKNRSQLLAWAERYENRDSDFVDPCPGLLWDYHVLYATQGQVRYSRESILGEFMRHLLFYPIDIMDASGHLIRPSAFPTTRVKLPDPSPKTHLILTNELIHESLSNATIYRKVFDTDMLQRQYMVGFDINRLQSPLDLIVARHDLNCRYFHKHCTATTHFWTLLYTMYGETGAYQYRFCSTTEFNDANGFRFKDDLELAFAVGIMTNNTEWVLDLLNKMIQASSQFINSTLWANVLILAISRGMSLLVREWYDKHPTEFVAALGNINNRAVMDETPVEWSDYEIGEVSHYLFRYAVIFKQTGILTVLRRIFPNYRRWDYLIPIHVLNSHSNIMRYNLEVADDSKAASSAKLKSYFKSYKIFKSKYDFERRAVTLTVADRAAYTINHESELSLLSQLLENCNWKDTAAHQSGVEWLYARHLSMSLLFYVHFIDQFYLASDDDHFNAKHIWQQIINFLVSEKVITSSTGSRTTIFEPKTPTYPPAPKETDVMDIEDEQLDNSPYEFDEIDQVPDNNYHQAEENTPINTKRKQAEEIKPFVYTVPLSIRYFHQKRFKVYKNVGREWAWAVPDRLELYPIDDVCVGLLNFLASDTDRQAQLTSLLHKITDTMDEYHVFIRPKTLLEKKGECHWSRLESDMLFDTTSLYGTRYSQKQALKDFNEFDNQEELAQDVTIYPFMSREESNFNKCLFEVFILEFLQDSRGTVPIEIVYPLLTLAGFSRTNIIQGGANRTIIQSLPLIYFLPITVPTGVNAVAPLSSNEWYLGTPLHRLHMKLTTYLDHLTSTRGYPQAILNQLRSVLKIIMVLRHEHYQKYLHVNPMSMPLLASEMVNIHTHAPLVNFHFNLDRTPVSHHAHMKVATVANVPPGVIAEREQQVHDIKAISMAHLVSADPVGPVTPRAATSKMPSNAVWNELVTRWKHRLVGTPLPKVTDKRLESDLQQWETHYQQLRTEERAKSRIYNPDARLTTPFNPTTTLYSVVLQ